MSELMKKSHDKYKDRIRMRVWYLNYRNIAECLHKGSCQNPVKVLKDIHDMINNSYGYGYCHISVSAYESLQLVVEDMGWQWTE